MIKVLISENHYLVREGLKMILSEDPEIKIVGEAQNSIETIEKIQTGNCKILILDLNIYGINGLELISKIKLLKPGLRILVLSLQPEDKFALLTLKAGASGYLCTDKALENLAIAIKRIHKRGWYLSELMIEKMKYEIMPVGADLPHWQLTGIELRTVCMLASGLKVRDIASELNLSKSTVFAYRVQILKKLNIKNVVQLTHYAINNNLIGLKVS